MRATFLTFRKGKTTQSENQALLKIEGLNDRKEVPYYLGKRVVYVYKTTKGFRVNIFK
jgi:large subunit ribosomal protein L35Ae